MTVHARIPAHEVNGTALHRDFVSSSGALLQPWLPAFGATACVNALQRGARIDAALVAAIQADNRALGVDAAMLEKLSGLADGSVRAVVTGQQPGVAGGPLMSLHKAAAAIALARRIETASGHPCVPLFWLGADDDDFAEVRELSVLGADYSRLDVAIDASAYRPGLRVGDIDATAVRAVWSAIAPALPGGTGRDAIGGALSGARDFAGAAASALVAATAGSIAVIDGRAPELRLAAKDLLLDFYDRESRLRELLDAGGRELEARGYHAQVQWGGDSGLFLVDDGIRRRVPGDQRATVRDRFKNDITLVSPGVIARNLLQDAVLSPVAVVLGPAEIAYRAQMAGVYREMRVEMPVVFPRFSAVYLPPAVHEMAREANIDVRELVSDPGAAAALVAEKSANDELKSSAATLEERFAGETRLFMETAAGHLDDRARQKLEKRFEDLGGRLGQALAAAIENDLAGPRARWPFLPRMKEIFVKDGAPQERFISLLTPMLFDGDAAWPAIDDATMEWAAGALDGHVWHGVYSV
jgi:bacillithiol synthase